MLYIHTYFIDGDFMDVLEQDENVISSFNDDGVNYSPTLNYSSFNLEDSMEDIEKVVIFFTFCVIFIFVTHNCMLFRMTIAVKVKPNFGSTKTLMLNHIQKI